MSVFSHNFSTAHDHASGACPAGRQKEHLSCRPLWKPEIGVWPQWARQDFLVLLYFGYLCACPASRLLRWCFLLRCKSVDRCGSRQKRARSSVQQMKASLEKYGLSICWRARSVSARILVGLSMVGMVQSFSDYGFRAAGLSSIPGSR